MWVLELFVLFSGDLIDGQVDQFMEISAVNSGQVQVHLDLVDGPNGGNLEEHRVLVDVVFHTGDGNVFRADLARGRGILL